MIALLLAHPSYLSVVIGTLIADFAEVPCSIYEGALRADHTIMMTVGLPGLSGGIGGS